MTKKTYTVVFAFIFILEVIFGYYVAVHLPYINGDAISRVANAFYVLYSRDPHLAAVGFIWNPLPSFLAMPVLLFQPWLPTLSSAGLSSVIITSAFAGLTAVVLLQAFYKNLGSATFFGIACTLLFVLNPFQFWYGANGMSEALFGFFLLVSVIHWTQWIRDNSVHSLTMVSLMLSLAFLTRYEAIPFSAAIVFATFWYMLAKKSVFAKIESTLLMLLLPVLFTVTVWLVLNYTIMGDALYFLHSSYSNAGQSEFLADNPVMSVLIGNPEASFKFVCKRIAVFAIPYAVLLLFRLLSRTALRWDFLVFTVLTFSIPLFQWYMLYGGLSFGWLRFFYYPLLITIAWLPYELSSNAQPSMARALKPSMLAALAVSAVLVVPVMNNASLSPEEYSVIHYRDSATYQKTLLNRKISQKLDREIFDSDPNALVIADSFNAFEIILNSRNPRRFVNTTDRDFKAVLDQPLKFHVEYLLVPKPEGLSALNAVHVKYPLLYEGNADWAKLVFDIDDRWKLYRIVGEPHP
ncbi:hypothetical protein ACFPVX_04120 [Cohnella faecalis]|uniref:Glycosyltransferase RgtA/B/C/D-like domain-containing protein n=1 Tax=Cohnella faecalis TaxID=2315694 RepID=A0A398CCW0_9BACL|nr:hypothetical protein [Cohnella faecalis]RIE00543.1 hypothetical protein D3H35_27775 [Cohnella faecalis]